MAAELFLLCMTWKDFNATRLPSFSVAPSATQSRNSTRRDLRCGSFCFRRKRSGGDESLIAQRLPRVVPENRALACSNVFPCCRAAKEDRSLWSKAPFFVKSENSRGGL